MTGCATSGPPLANWAAVNLRVAKPIELTNVPFYPQQKYQCGPAALAEMLNWSGVSVTPDTLKDYVYIPGREGSLQAELIAQTRARGRLAIPIHGPQALLAELQAGHPVLVLQNNGLSWLPQWHYAVVIGYLPKQQAVILRSGTIKRYVLDQDTFNHTWRRGDYWGLLVLPPGELPVSVTPLKYAQSITALAQVNPTANTLLAWQAGYQRWPMHRIVALGFANALYAQQKFALTEQVLNALVMHYPNDGVIWNNLAMALAQQGKWQAAEAMATIAVKRGGSHAKEFEHTLEMIEKRNLQD
ncbi:MAG TPA: PA2778 family cysteine peptidase [Gammaproteobacteria bacterium]|nr:PA2778 family cysteine peptidase [Gammaproteobacteria bacterium]